jgi:glycerophosphoryl diester phosphodiesterase
MFKSIIGHRGDRSNCPENTLPSFQRAFDLGVDGIECDLRISKDGIGVIIHDKDLNRTGKNFLVQELTMDELKKFDLGQWKDPKWSGTQIPTLEETLTMIPKGKTIHLEIKAGAEALDIIENSLNNLGFNYNQVILTGFSLEVAALSKKRFPNILFLVNGLQFDFKKVIDTGADGIATYFNADVVSQAKEAGLIIRVGAVNSLDEAIIVSHAEVETIDTDDPEGLIRSIQDNKRFS